MLPEYRLTTPSDLGLQLEVVEDGNSFCENALLKARVFAKASERICLADDSGLEVDALAGAPGVLSARYGENHSTMGIGASYYCRHWNR